MPKKQLGTVIREERIKRGISPLEFEKRTGISRPYLFTLEDNRVKEIGVLKFVKIVKLLNGSKTELFKAVGLY